jgi:type IV pilus assembly protein PilV
MFFLQRHKGQKGFTLIEVMIALVILAVGLLALMTMQIVSIKANAFSSEITYSTMLAQRQLETLRNLSFSDADLSAGDHVSPQSFIEKGDSYTVSWNVVNTAADIKTVTLQVTWNSPRQGTVDQSITTSIQTIIREQ